MSIVTKRCSTIGCGETSRPNQRYCSVHHAAYMRQWRKRHREQDKALREENLRLRDELNDWKRTGTGDAVTS